VQGVTSAAALMLLIFTLALIIVAQGRGPSARCQKNIIAAFQENRRNEASQLVYLYEQPYSAGFY